MTATVGVSAGIDHADSLMLIERHTEVLDLLASGATLTNVLTAVAIALEDLIPGSRCSVLLLDPSTRRLHHGAAPRLPSRYMSEIDGVTIGPDVGSCGTAAHLRTPIIAEDIRFDSRWVAFRELAAAHGLRSCWSQPIFGRSGAVLGTFAVYHLEPHVPMGRELRLVGRFVHLSGVAIEHAGLFGALADSEERFRRAFEDNAVGMALTDLHGTLTKVNKALRVMLVCNESELLDRRLTELVHPDDRTAAAVALCIPARPGAQGSGHDGVHSIEFEARLEASDGHLVVVAATVSAVRGADGRPAGLCVNLLDVTQRRAAQAERLARREAEAARRTAEAASRAKSDFLAALSHEIRTPLQAVTGFTELLQNLDLSAERRRLALHHIEGAAGHILALVDDVLDIAKIEAGALTLQNEVVDVAVLVDEVVELLRPLAAKRSVMLRTEPTDRVGAPDAAGDAADRVCADRRRLRQVLINLVNNGLVYNHSGGWVRVTVTTTDGTTVEVTDSGPGISNELQERLFQPFDRLGAEIGGEPGAGLGLALSRALTEAMGGHLTLRGGPGGGTTASVSLPGIRCSAGSAGTAGTAGTADPAVVPIRS